MDVMSGIVVYFTTWWIVLLMALPFGTQRVHNPEYGHDHGAPKTPHLKYKLLATTLITTLLWFIIDYLIAIKIINFRELAG